MEIKAGDKRPLLNVLGLRWNHLTACEPRAGQQRKKFGDASFHSRKLLLYAFANRHRANELNGTAEGVVTIQFFSKENR